MWYNYFSKATVGGPVSCKYDECCDLPHIATEDSRSEYELRDDSMWDEVMSESSLWEEEALELESCEDESEDEDVVVLSVDDFGNSIWNDALEF